MGVLVGYGVTLCAVRVAFGDQSEGDAVRRVIPTLTAVATVLVIALGVVVVAHRVTGQRAERAAAVEAEAVTARSCSETRALAAQRDDARPVSEGRRTAVIVGDSWAQGRFLSRPREQAWSTLLGRERGWRTWVDAVSGSGLVNGGPCGGAQFINRAPAILARNPDVVVVEVGLNDYSRPGEREAAATFLARLAGVKRVFVVGPPLAPNRPADAIRQVDRDLAAASRAGVTYISTLGWVLPYQADRLHLTPEGHRRFAARVDAAISSR